MDLSDPSALKGLLARHGVRAAKSHGQHFLVDRAALAAIVDAAELSSRDDVLEVGPGPGAVQLVGTQVSTVFTEVGNTLK